MVTWGHSISGFCYGLQREKAVLRYGNTVKRTTHFIADDCERETMPAYSRYVDYIRADGRVVALHVYNTTTSLDSVYYVQTDLLGSWDRIVDGSRTVVQSSHFDPWGNRMSASDWSLTQDGSNLPFHRGFTGHEHYDRFGIINMNAWLYDPVIARFFSPDPQVQDPTSTQGFNRYSYCGNNPVMNTDPSGEFLISMAVVGGLVNYFIHKNQGDVSSCGAGWGYFAQGAIGGLLQGITWVNAISLISIGSPSGFAFVNASRLNIISTGASLIGNAKNAMRILGGRYYFDENMAHGFSQALTRYTTELPQTWLGYNYTQFRNLFNGVDRVDYFGGATFATNEDVKGRGWGVSIGLYINLNNKKRIDDSFVNYINKTPYYRHEYGHSIDSQIWGLRYLMVIGAPSLMNIIWDKIFGVDTHRNFYSEKLGNFWGARYFYNYFGTEWDMDTHPVPFFYTWFQNITWK